MSKFLKYVTNLAVEIVAIVIGWLVCVSVLAGAYTLGRWAAPHFGWDGGRDMFGLLSALTILWIYEHRNLEGKYDRLRELIDRQPSR
jgi:hypothetical protein